MSRGARAHDWLSLVEMSGLVLSEPVLHQRFPEGPEAVSRRAARALLGAWERFQVDPADAARRGRWHEALCFELLAWPRGSFHGPGDLPEAALVRPDDLEETLSPAGLLAAAGGRFLLALWSVPHDQRLDRVERRPGRWRATPQAKLERWLRGAGTPLGLLTNGAELRLVYVPPGLPAAWLGFEAALWFEEKVLLDGFATLLGAGRFFGPEERRLERLVAESQERQTELTDALGLQVRRAVERLLLALDAADHERAGAGGERLLAALDSDEIYRAALYAVMRLVFLLFAEERHLLPHGNVFYDEGYGLGRLLHGLEEERRQRRDTFERAADAWPRLLALFRLVFHGTPHPDLPLPAYGGDLFDPAGFAAMAVLERLAIPNAAVYDILRALTYGEVKVGRETLSQRTSYRTLDVEHIGYLYEGLLDHRAARAGDEPMVKLLDGGEEAHPLAALEARAAAGEEALLAFLAEHGARGGDRERLAARLAAPPPEALAALARFSPGVAERCRPFAGVLQVEEVAEPGRLYLTTSASRRATGTHYTPVQYTRAMVEETLAPLVHRPAGEERDGRLASPPAPRPPRELLALKICDPAMGSGAFLVQATRYLAAKLVDAWWAERERHGEGVALYLPYAEPGHDREERVPVPAEREEAELLARRLVAERAIYGVDVNPLAVEMAKLSLWLVTLSRQRPFSFLDHALKSGDSLLGLTDLDQLRAWRLDGEGTRLYFTTERVEDALVLRRELRDLPAETPEDVAGKARLHEAAEARVEALEALGDVLVSTVLAGGGAARQEELQARLLTAASDRLDDAPALAALARSLLGSHRPFHWPLEFPEVFDAGGFDAILGNPPYMGGQKLTGAFGKPYREHLVNHLAGGARGSADLVAYFFLRAFALLAEGGNFGLLAVNTIAEGDTRQVGLERLARGRGAIYSAHPNEPWPNDAAVVTSRVHVHKGPWRGPHHLHGRPVATLSPFLSDREEWTPKRLKANAGLAFQGSIVLGLGFTLSEEQALAMIERDPKNRDVLFPYLNGKDLNSHPEQQPSRWVIHFWDWPEEKAREYAEPFAIVEEKVKPQRMKNNRKVYRDYWWHFGEKRPALYHAIGRGHRFVRHPEGWEESAEPLPRVITYALVGKHWAPALLVNDIVYSHMLGVSASDAPAFLALLVSAPHREWAWNQGSRLKRDLRYTPSDCFETFPRPESLPASLERLGADYDDLRRAVMRRERVGLTTLYNRFHDPADRHPDLLRLRQLQVEIDRAVARAYGWDDLPLDHDFHQVPYLPENDRLRFTVSEPARLQLLTRLSQLNRRRYEEETARPAAPERAPAKPPAPVLHFRRPSAPPSTEGQLYPVQRDLFALEVAEPPPPPDDTSPAHRILTWLRRRLTWHARAEILQDLDLSDYEWNQGIRELLEGGKVERQGEKRGTRYRAVGGGDAPA